MLHDPRARRARWRSTTRCRSSTRPSKRPSSCRTATSRRGNCPTRRSACWTPPAPAWPSASTPCRPRWRTAAGGSRPWRTRSQIIGREEAVGLDHADPSRRGHAEAPARSTSGSRGWSALEQGEGAGQQDPGHPLQAPLAGQKVDATAAGEGPAQAAPRPNRLSPSSRARTPRPSRLRKSRRAKEPRTPLRPVPPSSRPA